MIAERPITVDVTPRCGHSFRLEVDVTPRWGDPFLCPTCQTVTEHVRVVRHDGSAPTPAPVPERPITPAPPPAPTPPPSIVPPVTPPATPMSEIPMRLIEACGGDVEQARRVVDIIAPAMRAAAKTRSDGAITLEATKTVMMRHLSILAKEAGVSMKLVSKKVEEEILDERVRLRREASR